MTFYTYRKWSLVWADIVENALVNASKEFAVVLDKIYLVIL